ncbi:CDP-alcohol phosphatidyltransferase family protein [Thermospira aquatica]|uniref:CDP-diacylglycerol--glycerol-3-phosphate 3-phosphatidyltransferase n=1 Tax=Thermospira aquatica TaxID=2828656 RepID=A0AAX3BAX3_9SPIR|nr:CDP-alcohol phosphatidyltransferase family protein [Thermospira aquatica]URA09387.1 CDP-alcohol phosphatidyltransferase family protein [Thermospira aquatica]
MNAREFWTIPNILTYIRILLIPFILYGILVNTWESLTLAFALYGLSALTDTFDGIIARKFHQSSEWGAYIDPLADKFLVWAVYGVFCTLPFLHIPWYVVLPILLRDLWVTWLRNYAKKHNLVFKTSFIAKAKTTAQMVGITVILFFMWGLKTISHWVYHTPMDYPQIIQRLNLPAFLLYVSLFLTILIVLFTLYTGWDYYKKMSPGGEK